MIIQCPTCRRKFQIEEASLQGRLEVNVRCMHCQKVFSVKNPFLAETAETLLRARNPFKDKGPADDFSPLETDLAAREPHLPRDRRYAIAIVRGDETGRVFPLNRPRMIIGRKDADIQIRDLEASRHHAAIEVYGNEVFLRDLNSSNGTYVDEKPIRIALLRNQCEFRIGSTVFMFIETQAQAEP